MAPNDCGDDDNFDCACGGNDCDDGCIGPGSTAWINTGEETEEGNAIYENEDGEQAEGCGGGGGDIGIILAPL